MIKSVTVILFLLILQVRADLAQLITELEKEATVSISLIDSQNDSSIFSHNSEKLLIPASNLKLISLATVLDQFPEDHNFSTDFFWDGSEIIIRGSGDPAISDRYHKEKFHIFKNIVDELKKNGITKIGTLSADNSLFQGVTTPPDWECFDKTFYYAPEISALSFNDNCIDLITDGINIKWFPFNTDFVTIINQQKIVSKNFPYKEQIIKKKNHFTLKSEIPQGTKHTEHLSVSNSAQFTLHCLRNFLQQNGISCKDIKVYQSQPIYNNFKKIFSHKSPKLSTLVKTAMHNSNNFFTEMLTWSASAHHFKSAASYRTSIKFIQNFLKLSNLPTQQITDSCGLSRSNQLSTNFFTTFLKKISKQKIFQGYLDHLPVSGSSKSLDFLPTELAGKIHAKTGSMTGVYALSGYINKRYCFSIIINQSKINRTELKTTVAKILKELCRNLAS